MISTHAPLAGRDQTLVATETTPTEFQPTRPLRGATAYLRKFWNRYGNISTHAPLAGRDPEATSESTEEVISTHAPLAGRDC